MSEWPRCVRGTACWHHRNEHDDRQTDQASVAAQRRAVWCRAAGDRRRGMVTLTASVALLMRHAT